MRETMSQGRDPLSMVLVGAVVLLGVMYVLDDRNRAELLEREQAAKELGQRALAGCEVAATGAGGARLMVRCEGSARAQSERLAGQLGGAVVSAGFAEVALRGGEETVVCPAQTSGWPEACQSPVALPDKETLREKQRRSGARE